MKRMYLFLQYTHVMLTTLCLQHFPKLFNGNSFSACLNYAQKLLNYRINHGPNVVVLKALWVTSLIQMLKKIKLKVLE